METTRRNLFKRAGGLSLATAFASQLSGCGGSDANAQTVPNTYDLPAKAQFPGVADQVFLNAAADHPWPKGAADAVAAYGISKYAGSGTNNSALAKFAKLINAEAAEVTYCPSTSMGEYLVTQSLGIPEVGGRIVTDALHFTGSFYMYEQFGKQGMDVVTVRMNKDNGISLEDMERAITPGTRLVAISQVSLYNGFEHDVKAVCDLAHSRGALVYVDLIQAAGAVPVDVKKTGVDFAACGTYKWLMGDFGFAFLYVKASLLPQLKRPWFGYRQTQNFASPILRVYPLDPVGEPPYESRQNNTVAGYFMGSFQAQAVEVAASYSIDWLSTIGIEKIQAWRQPMVNALQTEMRRRGWAGVTPLGSKSGIVTFAYPNAASLAPRLAPAKIAVTLRANHLRVSPSVFNDMNDIDKFLGAIGNP